MEVTESGMETLANELHPRKAPSPMVVTESGTVMLANELHPEKAHLSMVVTESGIVTVISILISTPHVSHKNLSMLIVPSGILKCPLAAGREAISNQAVLARK